MDFYHPLKYQNLDSTKAFFYLQTCPIHYSFLAESFLFSQQISLACEVLFRNLGTENLFYPLKRKGIRFKSGAEPAAVIVEQDFAKKATA